MELENSVAKFLLENERRCKEINHVKQVFKDQFDSIKKTRVRTIEQRDSFIDKLNLKSAENENLKAQIQDKVFVITTSKNYLRKLKGKEIVDITTQTPSAYTIVPDMFKLDLEPLDHRLLQNREAHIDYLKYTQEQADILQGIVEQAKAKQPLDNALDFSCYPDCSLVSGLQMFETYDREPLSAHELCKLDAKADIGIFVGYALAKKAFRIYNRKTQKIIETIHVSFDELTTLASEQFSSGPGLHSLTPATFSTRLGSNSVSQQPCIPLIRDNWDPTAPNAMVLADSPVSTSIDQDPPSPSIPSTQEQEHSLIISQGFEELPKTLTFHDDPLHELPHGDSTSQGSSNVRQIHTLFELFGRWPKDHA
nr:integrase, catalytic region, zinc finger, CCHC-type, peptidase aspartic, catalytic [Tanacetum cinerariifolium]